MSQLLASYLRKTKMMLVLCGLWLMTLGSGLPLWADVEHSEPLPIFNWATGREIAFIDAAVENRATLLTVIPSEVEVVILKPGQDGLKQIAFHLHGRRELKTLHLLSHGSAGRIQLGNIWLDQDGLGVRAHDLSAISQALAPGADILLYGCDVARGADGRAFVEHLADQIKADVAASTNPTGSLVLGGDSRLEIGQGTILSESLNLGAYPGLLAETTLSFSTTDSGNWADGIAEDGNGGSTNIGGITIQIFNVSDTSGTLISEQLVHGDTENGDDFFALTSYELTLLNNGWKGMEIQSSDGTDFQINGFAYWNYGEGAPVTITVKGYRDNVEVASTSSATSAIGLFQRVTFTLGTDFDSVDSVILYSTNNTWHGINDIKIDDAILPNNTPAIANLNTDSVAWAGVGNTVVLDASANASLTDTELGALNSGNGNWSGGSLAVQRSGTAISADTLGFNTSSALFTVSGSNLQSGGQTFATFTNTGGVLTISFTSSGTAATTALVNDVAQRITYRNDTPSGDATVRFTLSDGNTTTTADVTVSSNTIYVTNTTDTATIDITNGVSFSEAVAIAAADATGSQTIVFSSSMAATALTINSVSLNESLTIDMDAANGMSLTSGTITLGAATTQTFTNGTSDTASISSVIAGSGALTKAGAGTLTLSNSNTYTGTTTVSAGTLTVSGGTAIHNEGAVSVSAGAGLTISATEEIGSLSGAGTVTIPTSQTLNVGNFVASTFSGNLTGAGGLTINQSNGNTNALTLTGDNSALTGQVRLVNYGRLTVNGENAIADSAAITANFSSVLTLLSNQTIGSLASNATAVSLDIGGFTLTTGGNNGSTTVSGTISGTGNLVKQGSGTMTLGGTNTYNGTTTVSAGVLSVTSDSNLGSNSVTLASSSTLDITGATTIDNAIALSGDATVSTSANATLSGVVSGANTLTKAGASTLTLSNTNTYAATTVSAGTLSVASDANLGSGTVTLGSGGTLEVTGATNIDNGIVLSGNATISNSANATLSGVISGANTLTKAGASTLTLSNTNTYAGTTVSAGTLSVASDSNLGSGSVTLASGTTLAITGATNIDNGIVLSGNATVSTSANATLSGVISGGFNLAKTGASTLTLSNTNTYGGTTTVSAGTLSVASDSNLGSGGITLAAGTTLAITGATTIDNAFTLSGAATINTTADATLSGNIGGAGSLAKTGASSLTLSGTNSYAGTTTVSAGTLSVASDGGFGSSTITQATGSTLVITGTTTIDNAIALSGNATVQAANAVTLSGAISGAGGLNKTGAGTLTLSGSNGFTGNVAVSAGGLTLSGGAAIDNNSAVTMSSGTTLTLSSSETIGSLAGAGSVALGANTLTAGGDNTSTSYSGNISGTGGGITKTGAGTLTLSGTNSNTGSTTISAGAIDAQNGDAIGNASAVSIASGAFLVLSASETIGSLAGAGTATLGANTLTTGGNNTSTTFSGSITGSNGMIKTGSGTFTLSNTGNESTLTGGMTISAGTVSISDDDQMAAGTLTLSGGTLSLDGPTVFDNNINLSASSTINSGGNAIASGVISGAGDLTKTGSLSLQLTNTNTYTGTTFVNAGYLLANNASSLGTTAGDTTVASGATLYLSGSFTLAEALSLSGTGMSGNGAIYAPSGNSTISGAVTLTGNATIVQDGDLTFSGGFTDGVGSYNLTKAGTGTLTLSGTASYDGPTLISSGGLSIGSDSHIGSGALTMATGTTLAVTGATTIDNAIALSGGTVTVNTSAATTLSGNITGAGGLTKVGASALTLSGTGSFTGATNVNAGSLLVNGALTATSNTTAASAATLGGSGSISSNLTVNSGGTLSPGNSPGTLTINGDLAMASGSTLAVEIDGATAGTGYDQIIVNGTVDVSGATLSVTHNYTAGSGDSYNIIVNDAADAVTGSFTGVSEGATLVAGGNSTTLTASYIGATGNDITLTAPTFPVVTSVSASTSNGTYKIGDTISISVTFDMAVFVNTGGGTPTLLLETGIVDRTPTYASGSSGTTLVFSYTVQAGDLSADLDYASTGALALNGGTIQDALNNNAVLTLASPGAAGSLGANKALVIDGVRPTASIVVADTALAVGETSVVTITFNEAITGLAIGDFTVANGVLSGLSTGDGGITWTATLTPTASTTDTSNLITLDNTGVADAAGNTGTGTTDSNNYAIDTLRPTAGIVVTDTSLTSGETSLVTITFNEAVTGLTTADFTVANGVLSGLSTGDGGITWTATLTPTASTTDASNLITLDNTGVQDAAGNTGTGTIDSNNYAIDNVAPNAPSTPDLAQASDSGSSDTDNITNVTTPTFTGTAEAGSTVELFRGGSTSLGTTTANGSGNWSLTLGTALSDAVYSITARATDTVGQTGAASAALSVTIDTTVPAVPVITTITDDTGVSATDRITSDTTLILSGTAPADETVTVFRNAAQIGTATADSLGAWSFDYTGITLAAGTHTFTATTTDLAGNVSSATAAFIVEIDTDTPSAPLIVAMSNDTGASATDGITSDTTLLFAGTSDANVTVTLSRSGVGVIGTTTANGTGVWSFDYSGTTLPDGAYLFTAFASDTAGNNSTVSADFPVTIDATAPLITTQPAGGTYVYGDSFTLTVTVNDATALAYQWSRNAGALSDSANRTGSTTAALAHTAITMTGFDGSYTVQITDLAGNITTSNTAAIVVNKAPATVTIAGLSQTYDGTAKSASATTVPSGLTVAFTYDGSTTAPTGAGSYAVVATVNDTNYAGTASGTLVIAKADQTITFNAIGTVTVGTPATLTATASSGLGVTFSVVNGNATVSGTSFTANSPNPVTLRATQSGNANYNAATVDQSVTNILVYYPEPTPDGYAVSATGGAGLGSQSVVVLTASDFRTHAESSTTAIITVVGILNLGTTPVAVASNKTIQGADANATLIGNLRLGSGVNNVVIRGLNLTNPGTTIVSGAYTDGGDALTLTGARNVFITHCSFFDTADHAIEITNGADNITVSWSEFYYTVAQTVHRYSVLIGNATGETTPLRVSLHHNLWSTGVDQRMPLSTAGHVHLYNNYFNVSGNTEGTVASDNTQFLSERNVYNGVANPLTRRNVNAALPIGRILALGNSYTATTGTAPYAGADSVFTPSYSYEALPASDVALEVTTNAGNNSGANYTDTAIGSATISGPAAPVTPGTGFILTAVPSGVTPASFQWRRNNLDLPGATSSTYSVASALQVDAATYTVAISLATGDVVVSRPFTVTLNAVPVVPEDNQLKIDGGGALSGWYLGLLALLGLLKWASRRRS
jgi:autotransporter-associated beta strand protein